MVERNILQVRMRGPRGVSTLSPKRTASGHLSPLDAVRALHRSIGNRAVRRLAREGGLSRAPLPGVWRAKLQHDGRLATRTGVLQAALAVSHPTDSYEIEADQVARTITSKHAQSALADQPPISRLAVAAAALGDAGEATSDEVRGDFESRLESARQGGQPLPDTTAAYMEGRFGADFSGVRVHADSASQRLALDLDARAFTQDRHIYLGAGEYQPGTESGQRLLAHELTHVVQQGAAGARQRPSGGQPEGAALNRAGIGAAAGGPRCAERANSSRAGRNDPGGAAAPTAGTGAPPAPADKELRSALFSGDAELKDVLNKRKLLRAGSKGDAVKRVQQALLAEGYELPKFGADGAFGKETASAVKEFQTRWRMNVDGIVGDQTLGLLDAHVFAKGLLTLGEQLPLIGGLVKGAATTILDVEEADKRKTACPANSQAERLTACVQPISITDDAGASPTAIPSLIPSQRIWEKCCINLSVLPLQTVKKTSFQVLDESPSNVPTAEETALFTAAGTSGCIQVFIPQTFQQGANISKDISGGGATYDAGTANPKVVVVEGAVPEVIAHELGHALGHLGHDAADTIMKPTGAHTAAGSHKVSAAVAAAARTGTVLATTSGKADCCMFLA